MSIKSHKLWDLIGAFLGIVIIIMGFVVANDAPRSWHTESSKGSASFGADFYTYVYSAADAAARNAAVAANNLRDFGETQAKQVGTCLELLGALVVVYYGKSFFCSAEPKPAAAIESSEPPKEDEEAPAPENPAAETDTAAAE